MMASDQGETETAQRRRNLPTDERYAKGGISVEGSNSTLAARERDPLRIDKLLARGVIDEMQHFYGLQIITLWWRAGRPAISAVRYDDRTQGSSECKEVDRITAADQYIATQCLTPPRSWRLIYRVCMEEKTLRVACAAENIGHDTSRQAIQFALEDLGNALDRMRQLKRAKEKSCP